MKLTFALVACTYAAAAFGGVVTNSGSTAGSYAGKKYGRAPAPAPVAAPAPAPAPAQKYHAAPAPAPHKAPATAARATYAAPAPAPHTAPATSAPATYAAPAPAPSHAAPAYSAAPAADTPYEAERPVERCWTERKRCCFEEKADGYSCKDDYELKRARCHRKIKYERKCGKAVAGGKPGKPDGYVDYGETHTVAYDANYGPHVQGYPRGESEVYETAELPMKPYGVEAEPVAAYQAPAPAPAGGYAAPAPAAAQGY